MYQCEECGHCIKGVKLVDEQQTDESMRVFCPAHDMHDARYTDGRPLLNDRCPLCEIEKLSSELQGIKMAFAVQDKIMQYQSKAYVLACAEIADIRFTNTDSRIKAAKFYAEQFIGMAKRES